MDSKRGDAKLRRELEKQQARLQREIQINAALAGLAKAIISPDITSAEMYQMVLQHARELTQSQHGFVSSVVPDTGAHISNTLTKMRDEGCTVAAQLYALPEEPHQTYKGLWGNSLNVRAAFFTNEPQSHPAARGLPSGHVPLINFLAVPIMYKGDLLGQIALANAPDSYSADDLSIVERIGDLYALVLHNRRREEDLQRLATTDDLTGLWNRRQFMLLGQHQLEQSQRYGRDLAVIIGDLDFFKRINDNYGHQAGDLVLSGTAKKLVAGLRTADIAGRLGGEEFAIVLPGSSAREAHQIAERLRQSTASAQYAFDSGDVVWVTISFGVAEFLRDDHAIDEVIQRADQALYQAKEAGRNQVCVYGGPAWLGGPR
jgi:diguanylate cyclase (GGDEF)-like protein